MPVQLTGMTWSHSRGYSSLVAVSQRYEELHPEVKITWEKRSLADFESQPVGQLAENYDMLVIDHPWTGFGAASGILLPLDEYFPADFLMDQKENSIGPSYRSYTIHGKQFALPIDGAAPIAVYRQDLMEDSGVPLPKTWEELLRVAKSGKILFAGAPLYTLLDFFMMCATIAGGETSLYRDDCIVAQEVGEEALERQRELAGLCHPEIFEMNPIQVYESMSQEHSPYLYCPFLFGYSNYFRPGYSKKILKAANVVSYRGTMLKTTLGGTGLALSAKCGNVQEAVKFSQYAASDEIQRTIFFDAGGQPGYKTAWTDEAVNRRSNGFFADTIETIEHASIRPRYSGYMFLQDNGGAIVQEYLKTGKNIKDTLRKLNALYLKTKRGQE